VVEAYKEMIECGDKTEKLIELVQSGNQMCIEEIIGKFMDKGFIDS
jgi:hypothetical protein